MRAAYVLLGGAALLGVVLVAILRAPRRLDDTALAGVVERSEAGLALGDALRSATELRGEPLGLHGASPDLVGRHVEETARLAAGIEPRAVVPLGPLRAPLAALALLGTTLALVQALAPGRLALLAAWLTGPAAGGGAAHDGTLARAPSPEGALLADIQITYRFPPYTGLPDKVIAGATGDLRALRGTEVALRATASAAVEAARLLLDPGEPVALAVGGDGRALEGRLVLLRDGSYAAELSRARGDVARDPVRHTIAVDDDAVPEVALVEPAGDLEVDELAPLDLVWTARDDFGVSALALVVSRDGREERSPLETGKPDPETHETVGRLRWSPQRPLEPGDEVTLRIEALDNDTVSGPKKGASSSRRLRVRSAADAHGAVVAMLDRLLDEELETLATALTAPQAASYDARKLGPVVAAEVAIGRRVEAHVQSLDEVLRKLWTDPLATERSYQVLSDLRVRLDTLAAEQTAASRRAQDFLERPFSDLSVLRDVRELRPRVTAELESGALVLDDLVHRERADEMKRLADTVLADQKKLADLLERYRRTPDPALRAEIERLTDKMEAKLAEIESRLAAMAGSPVEEFVNLDALRKQLGPDAASALAALKESLASGDLDAAAKRAEELTASLSRTMAALERGTRGAMALSDVRMADETSQAAERLKALASAQGKVAEDADAVRRDLEAARIGKGKDPGELFERARRKAAEVGRSAREAAAELDSDPELARRREEEERLAELTRDVNQRLLHGGDLSGLDGFREELFRLRDKLSSPEVGERLAARDALEQAAALAERTAQALGARSLESALRAAEPMSSMLRDASRSLPDSGPSGKASEQGDDLLRDLEALDRMLGRPLGEDAKAGDAERMGELARRQRSLRAEAGEVGEMVSRLGEEAPGLPPGIAGQLGQAADSMDSASRGLDAQDVEGGARGARTAKQQLDEALGELEKAQQQAQQGGSGSGGALAFVPSGVSGQPRFRESGGGSRNGETRFASGSSAEKVVIPGAGASLAPDAFRRDVLEGMKQPRPKGYEEALERYYRRLVR